MNFSLNVAAPRKRVARFKVFDVALEWYRCPDGVELHEPDDQIDVEPSLRLGRYLRFRSERRSPVLLEGVNLEKPVVMQFINCRSTEAQLAFHLKYGFLRNPVGNDREYLSEALIAEGDEREPTFESNIAFGIFVEKALTAEPDEKAEIINDRLLAHTHPTPSFDFLGPNQKGRIVLNVRNLVEFMAAETAVAAISDVGFVRCASCGDAFFTGAAAHRRSHAKTCSSKCRSALMRQSRWPTASA